MDKKLVFISAVCPLGVSKRARFVSAAQVLDRPSVAQVNGVTQQHLEKILLTQT